MKSPITSELAPGSAHPVIRLDGVSVRYRRPSERIPSLKEYVIRWLKRQIKHQDFWALRRVSLSVAPREVFGLIGPNGAGKSTLLKTIARVLRPTEGRVRVRGRVVPLLELGAGFDSELTGRENIYLNGATLGMRLPDIRSCFDQIVDFAELWESIDAPVRTYSSGMVARLGFAVATVAHPDVLLVDEVLAVGDDLFRRKSSERIEGFRARGTAILLVSHNLETIRGMCDRAAWLSHGELKMVGTAADVAAQYEQRA